MAIEFNSGVTVGEKQVVQFRERDADAPRVADSSPLLSDPTFKVSRAVRELRSAGYKVPASLDAWVDNVTAARRVPPAPVPPSPIDPEFGKLFDQYVTDLAAHAARVSAVSALVDSAKSGMSQVVRAAADDILADKKLRADFEQAAKDYRSAALKLRGIDTLQGAANADLDGQTVAAWHARTDAGSRLSKIVDTLKRALDVLAPLGWSTTQVLAFATDRPSEALSNTVRDQIHVPDVCRRWEALVAAGRPTVLVSSLQEYAERLSSVRGVVA